jgi:hypothetical protein
MTARALSPSPLPPAGEGGRLAPRAAPLTGRTATPLSQSGRGVGGEGGARSSGKDNAR